MKRAIVFLGILTLASVALAADIAKDPSITIDGVYTPSTDIINADRAATAVISLYEGTFTDLSGYYINGLTNAGHTVDYFPDPMGGAPYGDYDLALVTSSDNWWGTNFALEIPALSTYMDAGGKVIIVGQDWLWGSGDYGFAIAYLGMAGAMEDVNGNDYDALTWNGTAGGPLNGQTDSYIPCFASNGWYTDTIDPASQGLAMWGSPFAPGPQEGGCVGATGLLSSVEFGCGQFDAVGYLAAWYLTTATEPASFSSVKSLY